jgi:hypothetical protein
MMAVVTMAAAAVTRVSQDSRARRVSPERVGEGAARVSLDNLGVAMAMVAQVVGVALVATAATVALVVPAGLVVLAVQVAMRVRTRARRIPIR